MKNLKQFGLLMFGILIILTSCTGEQRKERAEKEFCEDLTSFAKALDNLEIAGEGTDVKTFNRAYNKADREWNELVKSANHLENVEIKESVKAYNKLVKSVNKINGETITAETADDINNNINATADKIDYLMTTECKD
jgi:uncharacterized protein with ParB-like and HNH nuclease domain